MTEFFVSDSDLKSLNGQVVLVTGASSGIGLASVKLLRSQNAKVVCGDINPLPEELASDDGITFQKLDVTDWKSLSEFFKAANSTYGKINHVFANAGVATRTTYLEEKLGEDGELLEPNHSVLDINLMAVVNTTVLAIHYMRRQETGGSIVLTASSSSIQRYWSPDYATAKHGVLGLLRSLTIQGLPHPAIRINAIAPSWTRTGLVNEAAVNVLSSLNATIQGPEIAAKSALICMADDGSGDNGRGRHGQLIFTAGGKYIEIENDILQATERIIAPYEHVSMNQLWEGMKTPRGF